MQVHNSSPVGIPVMTVHARGLKRGEETQGGLNVGKIFPCRCSEQLKVTHVSACRQRIFVGGQANSSRNTKLMGNGLRMGFLRLWNVKLRGSESMRIL